jgi:hypothetical protein
MSRTTPNPRLPDASRADAAREGSTGMRVAGGARRRIGLGLALTLAGASLGAACSDSTSTSVSTTSTSTVTSTSSSVTGSTTSAVPTTTVVASSTAPTAPTTTAVRTTITPSPNSPAGLAIAAFNAWVARDVTTLERLTSATAAQVLLAREAKDNVWVGPTCEGAAGSTYCTWTAERARLVLRVGNEAASTGQTHAVVEASFP